MRRRGTLASVSLFALAITAIVGADSAHAGALVESATVEKTNGTVILQLRFACPVQYTGHAASDTGSRVRVELVPGDQCQSVLAGTPPRDTLRPSGRALARLDFLESVITGPGAASLLLHFELPVAVRSPSQNDLRVLRLEMDPPPAAARGAAPPPPDVTERAAAALAAPPAAPDRASFPVGRTRLAAPAPRPEYAINLRSSREPISIANLDRSLLHGDQFLYLSRLEASGLTWYRLRLGFFPDEEQAESAASAWRKQFPQLWTVRVLASELTSARANPAIPGATAAAAIAPDLTQAPTGTLTTEQWEASMEDGRQAMLAKDYPKAIQAYTRVASEPGTAQSAAALEWLALARERNGQTAQAMAEYRRYLDLYPDGESAERVRQRLAGLETAGDAPKAARVAGKAGSSDGGWDAYGGAMQYYRHDAGNFGGESRTLQSAVLSDLDAVVEHHGERWGFKARTTAGNYYDMLDAQSGSGTDTRLYNLYAELADQQTGVTGRLGRQTLRNAGTPGRFDGLHLSWDWRPDIRFNLMTGMPAWQSETSLNTNQFFYGGSVDFTQVADLVDVSVFYNTQEIDGIQDRQAVGGEVRYADERRSLLTAVDYDVEFSALNMFYALGNWRLDGDLTINASADFRKSPFLTTEDALIGQPVETIDDLLGLYTEEEIRQLAEDRSATVQTFSLGLSRPLGERFQINADITQSQFDSTPDSGGVAGFPDMGTEYYYSLYLLGYSLLKEGDVATLGLRYGSSGTSSTTMVMVDNRYPMADRWRLNPRLRVYYRQYDTDSGTGWAAAPSMRVFYNFTRNYRLELETGGEWASRKLSTGTETSTAYFVYMGYQADF